VKLGNRRFQKRSEQTVRIVGTRAGRQILRSLSQIDGRIISRIISGLGAVYILWNWVQKKKALCSNVGKSAIEGR
jgi:hypothetical protein